MGNEIEIESALQDAADFLMVIAKQCDDWAVESRSGGWSTHQIAANQERARECREKAARYYSICR